MRPHKKAWFPMVCKQLLASEFFMPWSMLHAKPENIDFSLYLNQKLKTESSFARMHIKEAGLSRV
jgi:hypothetical protein